MNAQEIIVAADKPTNANCCRAGDELGIVRISYIRNDRWRHRHGLDGREEFFFEQATYFGVGQLEFGVREYPNVFIENRGGTTGRSRSDCQAETRRDGGRRRATPR